LWYILDKIRNEIVASSWINRDEVVYSWIKKYVPNGHVYVEPFCDVVSLFWFIDKPFSSEVINDLHGNLIGIHRTLQDIDKYNVIIDKLAKTPFS